MASTPSQVTQTSAATSEAPQTTTASGQPDYSAAWALYYMQQQAAGAPATSTAGPATAVANATNAAAPTTTPTSG